MTTLANQIMVRDLTRTCSHAGGSSYMCLSHDCCTAQSRTRSNVTDPFPLVGGAWVPNYTEGLGTSDYIVRTLNHSNIPTYNHKEFND
jgi:hypothetical protein